MNIIIRQAIDTDFDDIMELSNQILEYHNSMMPNIFAPMDKEKQQENYPQWSKQENNYFLTAVCGGKVVGYLYATFKDTPWYRAAKSCELNEIGVRNDMQSKGIGTKLFNELLKKCNEKEVDDIRLNVYLTNTPAIKLYEKLGFKPSSYKMVKDLRNS